MSGDILVRLDSPGWVATPVAGSFSHCTVQWNRGARVSSRTRRPGCPRSSEEGTVVRRSPYQGHFRVMEFD